MKSSASHATNKLARGAAAAALLAAAMVVYWVWRSDDANSNPNVMTSAIGESKAAQARDLPANAAPYRTGIDRLGIGRVGAGTGATGGAADLNTGVLSGSSFHPKPR